MRFQASIDGVLIDHGADTFGCSLADFLLMEPEYSLPDGATEVWNPGVHCYLMAGDQRPANSEAANYITRIALYIQALAELHPEPEPAPELPAPNWDGFNAAIMVDPQLNALLGAVLTTAPAIALGVPSALAQVSLNGTEAFAIVFGALCQLGSAAPAARAAWASMAEANHLPADFVEIIRGSG